MEPTKCEDAVNENNVSAPDRPAVPKRPTVASKPISIQDGSVFPKKAPPLPVRPPNASSSKGEKPMPPSKPAIAAKPKPLTPKPVPGRKPVGVKVLPVPSTKPKSSEAEELSIANKTIDTNSAKQTEDEANANTQNDSITGACTPKPRNQKGVRVLPVPPKELNENHNAVEEKTEKTADLPKIQPRPTPRPRPVPQKRKSIIKKDLENVALDLNKNSEINDSESKGANRDSLQLDGVTGTASSDNSNAPIFSCAETDDEKVMVRNKNAENKEELTVKRKSSFVPTRKAPPPPLKPKVTKPAVNTAEVEGNKHGNLNNLAKNKEGSAKNNDTPSTQPISQTARDTKTSSTAQPRSASFDVGTLAQLVNEENEDSPLRPPRPNRLKKRLSVEGLLNDTPNNIAQNIEAQSSQKPVTGNTSETDKAEEPNVKTQVPGKLNIKALAANLNTSAVKALKHQIDTKNKPRALKKAKSEDSQSDCSDTNRETTETDSNGNVAAESVRNERDTSLQKELSEKAVITKIENEKRNLFSIVGMGAQDIFSHSFSNSNKDMRFSSPSKTGLIRSKSTEDLSAIRNQRLSRSHTVECLFDDTAVDEAIYEVIPDSPTSTATPTVRSSRRISRSSSMGQLLDLPARDVIGSRRGKPVFVPPPPPPYTPPDSCSPRFTHFPQPFIMEKSLQTSTASEERIAHSPSKSPLVKTLHDMHQPLHDIPYDDDNVYEDTENMELPQESEPRKETPPALPRKESVRTPNTSKLSLLSSPTKNTPKRMPSRAAPGPPLMRPATGRQVSKNSIPSMEAPVPPNDQLIPPPDEDNNVYDEEGYLAPTRNPPITEGDYSYAELPEESQSPVKTEPDVLRHDSTSRGGRESVTSMVSTDSHIYESIGSKTNTGTSDLRLQETVNRQSAASSKTSSKDRESNISNVSRSVFYLEVDEEEKVKLERELSGTDEQKKKSESGEEKDEDEYHIPSELEGYMGNEETTGGVDLDVEVPLPPRPPPRKKKPVNGATNGAAADNDDSEDDYIYPGQDNEDKKGSDDEGYHYPADMNTVSEPETPSRPPVLPPRQKPNATSTPAKTPSIKSVETEKSPAPPPRSTSKSLSFSSADKVSGVGRSSSSASSSSVGLSFKIPAIPPRQYDLNEEEEDYVVPPEPEDNTDSVKTSIPMSASFPVTLRNSEKEKTRRSSHGGDSEDRPASWASSDGFSSSPSYSSGIPSSLHSPLSISRTSNESGSSYAHTGSSDDDSDDGRDKVNNNESPEDSSRVRKKLFFIAQEIVTSERAFVDVLKLLNYDFRAAVDNANQDHQTIPPQLLNQILKFLPQLHKFNKELLKDLKKRIDSWDKTPQIGDIFVIKGPFLKLYTSYIREFENMTNGLDDARRKYPEFHKVCADFEKSDRCKGLALKHYMLKPIQRIPQYRLLLQDYERHLPVGSPDLQDTKMALVIVSEVAEHANQSMKYGDNFKKLWEIQHSLIGHFEVIRPGRTFIKEGILKKLSRKEMQPRMFYLLSDILLYTTPVSGGFRLNQAIPLTGMKVSLPNKEDFKNEFSILSTQRSFTISASTPEERDEWLAQMRGAIDENAKRRQSFDVRALQRTMSVNVNIAVDKDFKLGYRAPVWVPDARVSMCMLCTAEFTVTFRRHHCRSCGKVVCTFCSDYKAPLRYLEYKAVRVCMECYDVLAKEVDEMDEELPPVMAGEKGTLKPNSTFTKASIKAKFKAIRWSSFRKSKRKRPAILQEVAANADDADMSGYLKVWKGTKWKKLWFVLKGKALFTYKASEDTAAFESRVLLGYEVRTFNTWFEGVEPNMVFEIIHQGTQPIIFRTESPNSRDRWISAMQKAMVP